MACQTVIRGDLSRKQDTEEVSKGFKLAVMNQVTWGLNIRLF